MERRKEDLIRTAKKVGRVLYFTGMFGLGGAAAGSALLAAHTVGQMTMESRQAQVQSLEALAIANRNFQANYRKLIAEVYDIHEGQMSPHAYYPGTVQINQEALIHTEPVLGSEEYYRYNGRKPIGWESVRYINGVSVSAFQAITIENPYIYPLMIEMPPQARERTLPLSFLSLNGEVEVLGQRFNTTLYVEAEKMVIIGDGEVNKVVRIDTGPGLVFDQRLQPRFLNLIPGNRMATARDIDGSVATVPLASLNRTSVLQ